jgi:hypothetical protein
MKNNEIRLTNSTPFQKVNAVRFHNFGPRRSRSQGRGHGCGRIHDCNINIYYNRNGQNKITNNSDNHQK